MSSDSGESHTSAHDGNEDDTATGSIAPDPPVELRTSVEADAPIDNDVESGEEQQELESLDSGSDGLTFARRGGPQNGAGEKQSLSNLARRSLAEVPGSPETASIPDDTPSIQESGLSSPGSSVPASHSSLRPHRPTSLQPFERRFSSRPSPSPLGSPRISSSPAFLSTRSRQSSISSNLIFQIHQEEAETPQTPWDVVRWTKLKKITGQVFSEVGKRNFGRATCLAVAASLVIGTSKGFILVFDYQQVLKSIIGPGTKAIECGPVTALALSADHSTVAGGHATGHIFTWELARPAKPFLHIPPLERSVMDARRSDGHVSGVAVLHIGFLGTRHTALVSADDGGMAFSHLATRGMGAIARTVKITRILGRYPLSAKSMERPRKPSSVLAFAPLPLGNVEQPTDDMGLTALLTPYLLVIVSTTPLAQTQHKASRPKEIAPHSALSGCLAWFPAVKLKNPTGDSNRTVSKTKLVYCWSNVLTILDVECIVAPPSEREKPTELKFRPRSRWKSREAIVAVQWLSRSVLGVLTISQRLIVLEDTASLRMTDSFDLLHKHIYHADLLSRQLKSVVEQLDENDASMHGVVADAFYMSFRAYKGRLFLLGFNDVSIGTLSNWADRLMALMEDGDFVSAIGLATTYYIGEADKLTVGLPEDDISRHAMVKEKLLEMVTASLKYTFSRRQDSTNDKSRKEFAATCFTACVSMNELDFLFEDVYNAFEEGSAESVFFEVLEPYILDEEITAVPPNVLKDLIAYYASSATGRTSQLEEMICRLDTETMDINQVTTLCEQYNLYDALIYVWTRAIGDFITPFTKILNLIKLVDWESDHTENVFMLSALKVFPYMSYTFTGRVYPGGATMDEEQAWSAKKDMYRFLFSGNNIEWPPGSGEIIYTHLDKNQEPEFPYLRLILDFDASSFMSMLNEAFEDTFLNEERESTNGYRPNGAQRGSAFVPTRQFIINNLLGIITGDNYDPEDIIYFYMFIARNLPKYPQHIILPGSSLHQILVGLCNYPTEMVKDDCQLSAEYLLSVYQPPSLQNLIPLFEKAGFHRVLKTVYKGSQQFAKLLETYLDDTDSRAEIFDCIGDVLRPNRGLNRKQVSEVKVVLVNRATDLVAIDASRAATTIKQHAPDLLKPVLDALDEESEVVFHYLKALIEPDVPASREPQPIHTSIESLPPGFTERYVQLMCKYNSSHVADFVSLLDSGDLKLDPVLPALERSGVVDAAVVLMTRDGLVQAAMDRLVKHLGTLETALTGLIRAAEETPDIANAEEAVHDLLSDIQKYVKVGIWLSQGQTKSMDRTLQSMINQRRSAYAEVQQEDLELDELLWLDLVDKVVGLAKDASAAIAELDNTLSEDPSQPQAIDTAKITTTLRSSVQQTFSALLASTSLPPAKAAEPSQEGTSSRPPLQHRKSQPQTNPSFLRVLRTFLTRAQSSSPSLSDLRGVLQEIFAAYTFEETILSLANRFLDKEGFKNVQEINQLRQRGWRPRGQVCEGCRKRAWGPGAGSAIWESWEHREIERRRKRAEVDADVGGNGKGKGKSAAQGDDGDEDASKSGSGALVVFACRHMWHKACLEKAMPKEAEGATGTNRRLKCPLDA